MARMRPENIGLVAKGRGKKAYSHTVVTTELL